MSSLTIEQLEQFAHEHYREILEKVWQHPWGVLGWNGGIVDTLEGPAIYYHKTDESRMLEFFRSQVGPMWTIADPDPGVITVASFRGILIKTSPAIPQGKIALVSNKEILLFNLTEDPTNEQPDGSISA